MISEGITKQIGEALKARDEIRLSTLRMLASALNYEKIAKQRDLSEEEELAVVRKETKRRKEAIEAYEKGGASDRAEKEKEELRVLQEFLPPDLTDEELETIVKDSISFTGASSPADIGKVIAEVMRRSQGRAEGGKVAELVKSKLA